MDQAAKLRFIREKKNIKRSEIAALCDVNESTVGHWETGRNEITRAVACLICQEYGVRWEWWKNDEEPIWIEDSMRAIVREEIAAVRSIVKNIGDLRRLSPDSRANDTTTDCHKRQNAAIYFNRRLEGLRLSY